MGGGGFLGSILTTLDSTLGGGRKLFLPTYKHTVNIYSTCTEQDREI